MNTRSVRTIGRSNKRGLACTRRSGTSTSGLSLGRSLRGQHVLDEYPALNPRIKSIGRGTWTQNLGLDGTCSLVVPDTALAVVAAEACA